jgi:tetratricopeptide (TPR) repeat protein
MSSRSARRVALIGWDAADWKIIHPLLDRGLLPNLESIIERGVMGNLSTLTPALSPVLWNSIATGHTADRHGVLGFTEPDPVLGSLRPVASTARKTKALWNILSQSGLQSIVVNWFASHPAEPIHGAVVTNVFRSASHVPGGDWPVVPGAVHPERLTAPLSDLRVSPAGLTGDDLLPYIPQLARLDQDQDKRPLALATILAENITTHMAATWLVENEPWDLLAVYYDLIDHAGHVFMPYHPPRLESVTEQDFELYREVVNGVYCFQDLMLGRLMQLAGPDTTFIVLSDHGFHSGHRRPGAAHAVAALDWHRAYGMVAMAGPGIRRDELVFGAGLLDVAPTVLALFGLPAGQDMPGRVLAEAFAEPPGAGRIPTWEDVPGDSGMHPSGGEQDSWEAAGVIDRLIALGYVDPRGEDQAAHLAAAQQERAFTLALVHLAAGRPGEAIPLLEEVSGRDTAERGYKLYLAHAYHAAGRVEDCRAILDPILREDPDRPIANLLRGKLAVAEGDLDAGLACLLRAETDPKLLLDTRLAVGRVYAEAQRWSDAERVLRSLLALDDDNAAAHVELARVLLGAGRAEEAAASALDGIGLRFDDAGGHYLLGVALARTGHVDRAVKAFESCLALRPDFAEAREALALLGAPAA